MKGLELIRALGGHPSRARGQVIAIAALAMMCIVGGVAIVIDGGNAYAQQRSSQNGVDAAAEAGATELAQYLALNQTGKTDAGIYDVVKTTAEKNGLETVTGYYTNWQGKPIDMAGNITSPEGAIWLGSQGAGASSLPTNVQGVRLFGDHQFDTYFARVVGMSRWKASVVATAVAGRLSGGVFLPVVFPINIVDCETNGSIGSGSDEWHVSQPPASDGQVPIGQEYIVPLCKTGGGEFMILDLDPNKNCQEEVINPPAVEWNLPQWVPADQGNDCARKIYEAMPRWHGKVVTVPVCDSSVDQPCNQEGSGSNAFYHIVKVASFYVDYMSYENNKHSSLCQTHTSPETGLSIIPIAGNGSDACIAGWFVRYIAVGPVGSGIPGNVDAIGIQLIE